MRYLNLQEFRGGMDVLIENRVQALSKLRDRMRDSLENGDDRQLAEVALQHARAVATLEAYRTVLNVLDAHTFNLENKWGRWVSYMEGQEPPPVPSFHLSAKVASLVESTQGGPPPDPGLLVMAKLVLATIKAFDDFLTEMQAEYGLFEPDNAEFVDSATKVFEEIASQFWDMFGRPGFLQEAPDWFREAFAWAYPTASAVGLGTQHGPSYDAGEIGSWK